MLKATTSRLQTADSKQKVPIIGPYFIREIPASDNVRFLPITSTLLLEPGKLLYSGYCSVRGVVPGATDLSRGVQLRFEM